MSSESLTLSAALISVPFMTIIIFTLRYFPFAFFSKRTPPPIFTYVGKYLPPMVMAILIVYSLQAIDFSARPYGLAHLAGCFFTIVAHLWKKNAMISIFGGTIVYMLINNV